MNPLAFMANREYDFKQPPGEEYDWELVSPVTLKKLRVFHVLFGHDKRDIARDYIW